MEVVKETQNKAITEKKESGEEQNGAPKITDGAIEKHNVGAETYRMSFLMLGLDLPEPPLFKDVMEKNIIPQVFYMFLGFFFSPSISGHLWESVKKNIAC